ncbi:MAG: Crp/Fnr family transcriptional regulator [Muricauda sp. TMED12]|nr:MAG: Crp/Fnr family transcriptional regulator [Muricauda sp. TMED12]
MKRLIADITNTVSLTEKQLGKVTRAFKTVRLEKKDHLPFFGKKADALHFIESGLVRVYFLDKGAREITVQIGTEKMWLNNLHSFITQTPNKHYVEVLRPTLLYQIRREDLDQLVQKIPALETFMRIKMQQAYARLMERTLEQTNLTVEERYQAFQRKYARIEAMVPQYIIASYLNVSPEHLSAVKNRMLNR